jgi:hypothetical protein
VRETKAIDNNTYLQAIEALKDIEAELRQARAEGDEFSQEYFLKERAKYTAQVVLAEQQTKENA